MKKITVLDYGVGNIRNVVKALELVGYQVNFTHEHHQIEQADRLLLPGVGAFQTAMKKLENLQLDDMIKNHAAKEKPLLGICLGMQLLCQSSTEFGLYNGLGFFDVTVEAFNDVPKIPHVGWNQLEFAKEEEKLFTNLTTESNVYFVHSYRANLCKETIASTDYYGKFSSILKTKNIVGMQFHPEKSNHVGLQLLKNFGDI